MLTTNETKAIIELKAKISQRYSLDSLTLFGSKARGDDSWDSDIDVLSVVDQEVVPEVEEEIFDMAYDTGLKFNVVFGIVVKNARDWRKMDFHPLKRNIDREGIAV